MKTYRTAEMAHIIGIHPNTVRLYEDLGLIPRPERKPNGYRVFTDLHLEQFKLARTALQVEVLQNGLREKAIDIIKTSAAGDYDHAIVLTQSYLQQIQQEYRNAEEALSIADQLLSGKERGAGNTYFTRKEAAEHLQISMDALRNWEMNGLLTVKRRENGYRVYTHEDISLIKIIRSLRCANYSLAAILRMLSTLSSDPEADIREVIDTPQDHEGIISVCDKLLTSLRYAESNARSMLLHLEEMKKHFKVNPPL